MNSKSILLASIAICVVVTPIILMHGSGLQGTDDSAMQLVKELNPSYDPWAKLPWKPSGSWETVLFALQAALGAGFIGYYLGKKRRKEKNQNEKFPSRHNSKPRTQNSKLEGESSLPSFPKGGKKGQGKKRAKEKHGSD